MSRDPVCGKEVDPLRARGMGIWNGRTYYFCSVEHRAAFARDPGSFREGSRDGHSAPVPIATRRSTPTPIPVPQLAQQSSSPTSSPSSSLDRPSDRSTGSSAPNAGPSLVVVDNTDRTPLTDHAEMMSELPREDSQPLLAPRTNPWIYIALFAAAATLLVFLLALLRH